MNREESDLSNHPDNKKILSRWDDYSNNENKPSLTRLSVSECTNTSSSNRKATVHPSLDSIYVREFLPRTANDPILPVLRELFVHSFDQFYKEIEVQLKLKVHDTVGDWLHATFDEMQDNMLSRSQRCFILCSRDQVEKNQGVIGFLTLTEEEKGSVYVAQVAIDPENKRRGYGTHLMQYLRSVYPPGTFYWGLCRRANRPAVNFYLKHGAKFIDDEEVGTKYGYDPKLYTGFQFNDGISTHTASK